MMAETTDILGNRLPIGEIQLNAIKEAMRRAFAGVRGSNAVAPVADAEEVSVLRGAFADAGEIEMVAVEVPEGAGVGFGGAVAGEEVGLLAEESASSAAMAALDAGEFVPMAFAEGTSVAEMAGAIGATVAETAGMVASVLATPLAVIGGVIVLIKFLSDVWNAPPAFHADDMARETTLRHLTIREFTDGAIATPEKEYDWRPNTLPSSTTGRGQPAPALNALISRGDVAYYDAKATSGMSWYVRSLNGDYITMPGISDIWEDGGTSATWIHRDPGTYYPITNLPPMLPVFKALIPPPYVPPAPAPIPLIPVNPLTPVNPVNPTPITPSPLPDKPSFKPSVVVPLLMPTNPLNNTLRHTGVRDKRDYKIIVAPTTTYKCDTHRIRYQPRPVVAGGIKLLVNTSAYRTVN